MGCAYCQLGWAGYVLLRLGLGLPANVAQAVHRAQCVDVIDVTVAQIEQRLCSGAPALLLLWSPRCLHSCAFMVEYERFARLGVVRALRIDGWNHAAIDAASDSPLLHPLASTWFATPSIVGLAHGHLLLDPNEFFRERSAASLLRLAARLRALPTRRGYHITHIGVETTTRSVPGRRLGIFGNNALLPEDDPQVHIGNTEQHWGLE